MKRRVHNRSRKAVRSTVLIAAVIGLGVGLSAWKHAASEDAAAAAASQPEPMEVVTEAVAGTREHRSVATAIGTVLATRSITLRNEVAGTVRHVRLVPGDLVEAGAVLVALDVSVEEAELKALQAQAALAETTLARIRRLAEQRAVSAVDLDRAQAERDVALAQIERTRAVIARKTIRAPFRARVGIADVHPGQFLEAGTLLTTLQGVADAAHVDFTVAQAVAKQLRAGDVVDILPGDDEANAVAARISAVDARVDPLTRNATVRARIEDAGTTLAPGASVRVRVPVGAARQVVVVPVNAVRKGPAGDHVFVLEPDANGQIRAHVRPVQTGPVIGDAIAVLEGLNAGEHVAAAGSFKLREAVLVQVATDPSGAVAAR